MHLEYVRGPNARMRLHPEDQYALCILVRVTGLLGPR